MLGLKACATTTQLRKFKKCKTHAVYTHSHRHKHTATHRHAHTGTHTHTEAHTHRHIHTEAQTHRHTHAHRVLPLSLIFLIPSSKATLPTLYPAGAVTCPMSQQTKTHNMSTEKMKFDMVTW